MKPIVKFYQQFLSDLGLTCKEDGEIVVVDGDNTVPIRVKIKRDNGYEQLPLYLPIDSQLEHDDGKKVFFHPACESSYRGQSEILNALIKLVNAKVNSSAALTIDSLLELAVNKDSHSKLSQPVMELIKQLPEVSPVTVKGWRKLFTRTSDFNGPTPMITISVGRDKLVHGVKCSRIATLKVPLMESDNLYGVNLSKIAESTIRKTFDILMGDEDIINGSNSPTAPYFIALAKTFNQAMMNITAISKKLGSRMKSEIEYDGRWVNSLDKLHDWYRNNFYIQLIGNIGQGKNTEEHEVSNIVPATPSQKPVNAPPPQPQNQPPQQPHFQPPQPPPRVDDNTVKPFRVPQWATLPPATNTGFNQPYQQPNYGNQMPQGEQFFDKRLGIWKTKGGQPQQPQPQYHPPGYPHNGGGYQQSPQGYNVPQGYNQQPPPGYQPRFMGYDQFNRPIYQ